LAGQTPLQIRALRGKTGTNCEKPGLSETPGHNLSVAAFALQEWLRQFGLPSALIGGLAVSLLAKPRMTSDVDCLIYLEEELPRDMLSSNKWSIAARIQEPLKFADKNRVLLLQHTETGVHIDLSIGILPFEKETISRAVPHSSPEGELWVASPEDMIIMKAVAGRKTDWPDIESLLKAEPNVDRSRIRACTRDFLELLGDTERLNRLTQLLNEPRK
jgi:hypothetical protein